MCEKAPSQQAPTKTCKKIICLNSQIVKDSLGCLNFDTDHPIQNAIYDDSNEKFVQTDCDQQLLVSMRFLNTVKLTSFLIKPVDEESAPMVIKLFKDQESMSFDNAEDTAPTQMFELDNKNFGKEVKVKQVKFQKTKGLTVNFFNLISN